MKFKKILYYRHPWTDDTQAGLGLGGLLSKEGLNLSGDARLASIRERIQKGFYQTKEVDLDISDKLAQAFFDLDRDDS